jgi:integrase
VARGHDPHQRDRPAAVTLDPRAGHAVGQGQVDDLPAGFRYHDLRHYFASLLISSGADVKVVRARMRHASAKTTLDTYGHLWPDSDDSTRAAIEQVMTARADSVRTAEGGQT